MARLTVISVRGALCLMALFSAPVPHARGDIAAESYRWQSVAIVAGGYVPGIIFSPKQPGLIFCRTDIGGAYRWDDAAQKWTPLNDALGPADSNLMGCESIAPDPTDANKVYLAAGMYSRSRAAILRSNDGGKTFQITNVPFTMGGNENGRGLGERLVIDPNDPRILYFGSRHDGLWKSEDSAVTWTKVDSFPFAGGGNAGISFIVFDPRSSSGGNATKSIYAGVAEPGDTHLYHSADAGKTWSAVSGQPAELLPQRGAMDAQDVLYVTYGNGIGPNGVTDGAVWKLDTASSQWTDITPPRVGGGGGYNGLSLDRQHPGTLAVSTLNHWTPGDDVYRSTDGGKTWKSSRDSAQLDASLSPYLIWGRRAPRFGWWITALAIDPFDSNHVLYGTGATIWGTNDFANLDQGQPVHWAVAANGIEECAVLDLISPPAGAHLISAVGDVGGFRHDDLSFSPPAGMSHEPIFTNTYSLDFAALKPEVMVRSGSGGNNNSVPMFSYSEDGGATWKPLTVPASANGGGRGGGGGGPGRGSVIVTADGTTFLSTGSSISISTDRGQTWTPCAGLPAWLRPIADRANAKKLYALDAPNHQIYVSTDGGADFAAKDAAGLPVLPAGRGRGNGGGGAMRLLSTPGKEGDLWLLANRRLYHSTDGGENFAAVSPDATIYAMGFGKAAPGKDYPALFMTGNVGSVAGIFRSDDAGANWVRINDDQHQYGYYPTVVTGDPRVFGRVYLGTNGRGILYGEPATAEADK